MQSSKATNIAVGFLLGIVCYALLELGGVSPGQLLANTPQTVADHINVVERARWQTRNLDKIAPDDVIDPRPSLAYLRAAGAIGYVDFVIPPTVAADAQRRCLEFANEQPGILWFTGTRGPIPLEPGGEPPWYARFWFRESARPAMRQLIDDLRAMIEETTEASQQPSQ